MGVPQKAGESNSEPVIKKHYKVLNGYTEPN